MDEKLIKNIKPKADGHVIDQETILSSEVKRLKKRKKSEETDINIVKASFAGKIIKEGDLNDAGS